MSDFIRKMIQGILPSIRHKSKWAKNEDEIVSLFTQYFKLNQTTLNEVKAFLSNNHIVFNETRQNMETTSSAEELRINLPGSPIWKGLLPYGSHYHVRFTFTANVLLNIKVFRIVYEF